MFVCVWVYYFFFYVLAYSTCRLSTARLWCPVRIFGSVMMVVDRRPLVVQCFSSDACGGSCRPWSLRYTRSRRQCWIAACGFLRPLDYSLKKGQVPTGFELGISSFHVLTTRPPPPLVCVCLYVFIFMYVCVCSYLYLCMCVYMDMCMWLCIYVGVCDCILSFPLCHHKSEINYFI